MSTGRKDAMPGVPVCLGMSYVGEGTRQGWVQVTRHGNGASDSSIPWGSCARVCDKDCSFLGEKQGCEVENAEVERPNRRAGGPWAEPEEV